MLDKHVADISVEIQHSQVEDCDLVDLVPAEIVRREVLNRPNILAEGLQGTDLCHLQFVRQNRFI